MHIDTYTSTHTRTHTNTHTDAHTYPICTYPICIYPTCFLICVTFPDRGICSSLIYYNHAYTYTHTHMQYLPDNLCEISRSRSMF